MSEGLNMSRRQRRTPYTDRVEKAGVRGFSVVNHMLLPKAYQKSVEDDYWHLREHVQIWDVSCQRQVELSGPDAARLAQWMTPRNLSRAEVGQCLYVPIIDDEAGLINDPVLIKLADDHFWLSIADSDVLLYAKGLAAGAGMNVTVAEPDVSPLAIQGPKAEDLAAKLFGEAVRQIGFFRFGWVEFEGTKQLLARSGYSRQGGFEIYLQGGYLGGALWDAVWEAGQEFNISPGCPNVIERVEGGLFSYGNEMTRENNPLEIGLEKYCSLDGSVEYIGRQALETIAAQGVSRALRGVIFDGDKCPTCSVPWPVLVGDRQIGQITSAMWSPRLEANVAVGMIDRDYWHAGQTVQVDCLDDNMRSGRVSDFPM